MCICHVELGTEQTFTTDGYTADQLDSHRTSHLVFSHPICDMHVLISLTCSSVYSTLDIMRSKVPEHNMTWQCALHMHLHRNDMGLLVKL